MLQQLKISGLTADCTRLPAAWTRNQRANQPSDNSLKVSHSILESQTNLHQKPLLIAAQRAVHLCPDDTV